MKPGALGCGKAGADYRRAVPESRPRSLALPLIGGLAAVWATLPPYSGPSLTASRQAEVVDHVVPGAVLMIASAVGLVAARGFRHSAPTMLACGLLVALSGVWMTATHVPLVVQAGGGGISWAAVAYHAAPGLAVLALGAVWTARTWSAAGPVTSR